MNPVRYFHTLRHLRPVQISGRLWHRLNPAKPDLSPSPSPWSLSVQWITAVERPASMLDAETFRFLNVVGHVRCAADWNDPARERLWLYNLHYFDDLNALGAAKRVAWHRALIARWVVENAPGLGTGWEPYPTSLRIVNWVKWALAGNALEPEWIHSLAVQARWLRQRIEWHLLGNHFFANAKALVFAGLFFEGEEAAEWLAKGLKILGREIPEQVLGDGGHFELSPMYHAIILEDLLDLVNAAGAWPGRVPVAVVAPWREAAQRMGCWLAAMCHPDGGIAFFNDAALGIAPSPAELEDYAGRLGLPGVEPPREGVTHLADSGYLRLQRGPAVALLDAAAVGPDYLPGHAHADTLSFELSLFGQRVVVNSGTSRYGTGPQRLFERGTAAHSTVQLDDEDSSEVWGGFRVARRARPFGLQIQEQNDVLTVRCAHDGYCRLPGRPVHHRVWRLSGDSLKITDRVEGRFGKAVSRYYLHPEVRVVTEDQGGFLLLPSGQRVRWNVAGGNPRIVSANWYPEFGLSLENRCIEVDFIMDSDVSMELSWG